MCVTDHDDRLAFGATESKQLETITDCANISFVRMQEVNRPVLRRISVVAKGPGDLELDCPLALHEQIRRALSNNTSTIRVETVQALCNEPKQLRFSVWANTRPKRLKGHSGRINCHKDVRNIGDDLQ